MKIKKKEIEKKLGQLELDVMFKVFQSLGISLTSIKEYASILANGDLGEVNKEQGERLNKICELCDNLNSLVKGSMRILEIASKGTERKREEVSLTQIIEQAVAETEPMAKQKKITIIKEVPSELPLFWGERSSIKEILINLLHNSIKFTSGGGTITLDALCRTDGYIQVNVIDNGSGIDPKSLPKIFEPFYQKDKEGKVTMGLGLTIVKKIVEQHRGDIWVKSKLGEGSRFSFTFPVDLRSLSR